MAAKTGAKDAAGIDGHATDEVPIGKDLVPSSIAVLQKKIVRPVRKKSEDQTGRPVENGARPAAATGITKIDTIIIVRRLWNGRCRQFR